MGTAAITLLGSPSRAQAEPEGDPRPCRGDACAGLPPEERRPLLVPAATLAPPPGRPPRHHGSDAAGGRLAFGRVFTRGIADGWWASFDTEFFEVWRHALIGIKLGLEGWGSADGGGGGIPWSLDGGGVFGFSERPKSPRFVLAGGAGWDWAFYDRVKHVGQFGIFAPFAHAYAGVDFRGMRLFGQVSAQHRWGWGDIDRSQIRVGGVLSFDSELWDGP